jgi:hypothetical protein
MIPVKGEGVSGVCVGCCVGVSVDASPPLLLAQAKQTESNAEARMWRIGGTVPDIGQSRVLRFD